MIASTIAEISDDRFEHGGNNRMVTPDKPTKPNGSSKNAEKTGQSYPTGRKNRMVITEAPTKSDD